LNLLYIDESSDRRSSQEGSSDVLQSDATDLAESVDRSSSVDISDLNVTSLGRDVNVVEDDRTRFVLQTEVTFLVVILVVLVGHNIDLSYVNIPITTVGAVPTSTYHTSFGSNEQIGRRDQ
jgi:hypothetical protein